MSKHIEIIDIIQAKHSGDNVLLGSIAEYVTPKGSYADNELPNWGFVKNNTTQNLEVPLIMAGTPIPFNISPASLGISVIPISCLPIFEIPSTIPGGDPTVDESNFGTSGCFYIKHYTDSTKTVIQSIDLWGNNNGVIDGTHPNGGFNEDTQIYLK